MVKIGLEIHGYINTKEKLFCKCKSAHGLKISGPNINICPICTSALYAQDNQEQNQWFLTKMPSTNQYRLH